MADSERPREDSYWQCVDLIEPGKVHVRFGETLGRPPGGVIPFIWALTILWVGANGVHVEDVQLLHSLP